MGLMKCKNFISSNSVNLISKYKSDVSVNQMVYTSGYGDRNIIFKK